MKTQGIKVPCMMLKLPVFYWSPKLRKNPYGNRFLYETPMHKASF